MICILPNKSKLKKKGIVQNMVVRRTFLLKILFFYGVLRQNGNKFFITKSQNLDNNAAEEAKKPKKSKEPGVIFQKIKQVPRVCESFLSISIE